MDFPIADLMDEGACYVKLVAWLHPDGLSCPRCKLHFPKTDVCQAAILTILSSSGRIFSLHGLGTSRR